MKEMQSKITVRYYLTCTRMVIIKKKKKGNRDLVKMCRN